MLCNIDRNRDWQQINDHLKLNFSQPASTTNAARVTPEDNEGADGNIQQFMARYKRLLCKSLGKKP